MFKSRDEFLGLMWGIVNCCPHAGRQCAHCITYESKKINVFEIDSKYTCNEKEYAVNACTSSLLLALLQVLGEKAVPRM